MCTLLCVWPPRVESLFPPVLSKFRNQIPLAFKVWFSRNSNSRCETPRLGSQTWGSEPSLQWVYFCGISVLQFVSHPPSSYGIWFYCECAPPTIIVASPLSLDVGYLFWWVPLSSYWWLFSSKLWFWCSRKREWEHVLLLGHLEPISLFFNLFILFIYFLLHLVFVAVCGLSLVAASGGYSSLQCTGFWLWWLLMLWSMGSRCAGFSSSGTRPQSW